jgi:hypothetical protein
MNRRSRQDISQVYHLSLEGFWLVPFHGRRKGVLSFARVLLDYAQKRRQYRGRSG